MYSCGYVWDSKIIHVHLYRHFAMNADIKSVSGQFLKYSYPKCILIIIVKEFVLTVVLLEI